MTMTTSVRNYLKQVNYQINNPMGFIQNLDIYKEFQGAFINDRFVMDRAMAIKYLNLASDIYDGTARMTYIDNTFTNAVQNVRLGQTINQLTSIAQKVDSSSPYRAKLNDVIDKINHENDMQKIESLMSIFLKLYKQYQEEPPVGQIQTIMEQIMNLDKSATYTTSASSITAETLSPTSTKPPPTTPMQSDKIPASVSPTAAPMSSPPSNNIPIPPPPPTSTVDLPVPPPPPPPPPMFKMFEDEDFAKPSVPKLPQQQKQVPVPAAPAPALDMHSELMAAIRRGSSLKKVKKISEPAEIKKPASTANPLMNALNLRLDARKMSSEESVNEDENGWLSDTQAKNATAAYTNLMNTIKQENIQNEELTSLSMAISRIIKSPNMTPNEQKQVEMYLDQMKSIIAQESTA
ncbi:PP78/83 [Rachiplusia nu nucleopolyhedrovirus]|uniref:PP78/83 n=1 Tax=Rachiplusia nu nucleopolyhedrovirus TaxID=2605775 RepID=A0AAE6M5P7_9ABAC|nr:PP78/83 [Rachiplusia nu nucleopolyhedrovirus]QEI03639.1 PP78/83 [Rachiplusia nu nucleopolyhedrovirus]